MRHIRHKPIPTSDKVVVFTGGVKEDVAQVELRPGELINSMNIEEVDGIYHGYASLPGYEPYDGQTLASDIPVTSVVDRGIDVNTRFLLESNLQDDIVDLSYEPRTVVNTNVIHDPLYKKFLASSFFFNGSYQFTVTDDEGYLNLEDSNFTIDALITPQFPITNNIIMQRGGCYAFTVEAGKLEFKYSTDGISWTNTLISDDLIVSGTRYHVAVVREDTRLRLAIEGDFQTTEVNIGTDVIKTSTDVITVGQYFIGWMDEIRLSTSTRWHNDFDIPTKPYSTINYYEYQYDDDDREAQRALIDPVPGASSVLGVNTNGGELIACRDNVGITATEFFEATPTGWSAAISGAEVVEFEVGADTEALLFLGIQPGDVITGSVSGETATVVSITTESGSWQSPGPEDAQGKMVIKDSTGTFDNTDVFSNGGTSTAEMVTDSQNDFVLEPTGSYEFKNGKFDLFADHQREEIAFFTNGVNYPCYHDGTNIVPILHTALPDNEGVYATYLAEFKNRLFIAYPDGRLWYSGVGNPLDYDTAIGGAGVVYMEDEITGLQVAPGDVLVVFGRNSIQMIQSIGDVQSADNGTMMDYKFINKTYSKRSGCIPNTNERILGQLMFMDDRGLTQLEATDKFGDFTYNSLSKNVQRTILRQKTAILGSLVDRVKNQYRLFFDDKTGIIFTFDMEKVVKGATFFTYLTTPTYLHDGEDVDGYSHKYMGTADGYVMKIDSGTSFNGEEIETLMSTSFFHYGTPTKWKRFRKATLEGQAEKDLIIYARTDFNYKDPRMPGSNLINYTTTATGGVWGYDSWGSFQYGSGAAESPSINIRGYGVNMGLTMMTSNKYTEPHIYNSMTVEYSIDGRSR